MLALDAWWASGERVPIMLPSRNGEPERHFTIFIRSAGSGPWLTLLHGFPTSSWDYAAIADELGQHFRLLFFDFLGFGNSDKPAGHRYSIFEQADIAEAVWRHVGITHTLLVAHDYGDTVALELLTRQREASLQTRVDGTVLLNGGIYVTRAHLLLAQVVLQWPLVGALMARSMSEESFAQSLRRTFAPDHRPSRDDLAQHWRSIAQHHGQRNYHRIIRYLTERRMNRTRWESTLAAPPVPFRFVWGMRDPISGAQMMEALREQSPGAQITELPTIGHYPQIEAPEQVATAIREAFQGAASG